MTEERKSEHPKSKPVCDAETVGASAARESFPELIERVKHTGERIVIERRGREMAALVTVDDLRILEALEDDHDVAVIKARLREKTIPAKQVHTEFGL